MTIKFVVTMYEWDTDIVAGVFSSREKAEAYIAKMEASNETERSWCFDITELNEDAEYGYEGFSTGSAVDD